MTRIRVNKGTVIDVAVGAYGDDDTGDVYSAANQKDLVVAGTLRRRDNANGTYEGSGPNYVRKVIRKTGLTDNTATEVFTITTTNEAGSTDGGTYMCKVTALIIHADSPTAADAAARGFIGQFARVMQAAGTGANSAVSEVSETASAASTPATRDIDAVTMTVVETSEFVQSVQFTVDISGTDLSGITVVVLAEVIYSGFTTAPTIA